MIRQDPLEALQVTLGEQADELSGGMKQRLALSRAFLRAPRLYVFDEITANLDANAADYVLTAIEDHARRVGAGIVYISHDDVVTDRCDQVITLKNKLRETEKTPEAA